MAAHTRYHKLLRRCLWSVSYTHLDVYKRQSEYTVEHIIPNDIIRVEFRLGFRMQPRLNLMFKKVVEDLVANREVNIMSRYER